MSLCTITDTNGVVITVPGCVEPSPEVPRPSAAASTPAATPAAVTTTPTTPDHHAGGGTSGVMMQLLLLVAIVLVAAVARRVPAVATSRVAPVLAAVERGARRVVRPLRWATRGRVAIRLVVVIGVLVGVVVIASFVPGILRIPVFLAALAALGWTPRKPATDDRWYSHTNLVHALAAAGILRAPKPGEPPPVLHYRGRVVVDELGGTTVVVALPAGKTASDVIAKREALAGALGLPAARLYVTHEDADPAGVVRLHVAEPRATGTAASPLATATRTSWSEPVPIGVDPRGRPVVLATDEANALLAGQPGAGKSTVAKIVLSHALLDPAAEVYLLDGKGSMKDYGAARPLCRRFVSGVDDDAVDATVAMLDLVLDIVRARNADGGQHGGVLLLLEELQDVRAAAGKADREQLDNTLGRIVRMGRAVGVSVLISTQRPSVDDLPSGVRNLISQRLALQLRNGQDAALVLGVTPELPLPKRRGEALLTTSTGTTTVALDLLDQSAWEAVCRRAAALRPARRGPERPQDSQEAVGNGFLAQHLRVEAERRPAPPAEVEAPAEPVEAVLDPLLGEVLRVLQDSNPQGLPATALLGQLPAYVRPASPAHLGKALAGYPDVVERRHVGKAPVWRLRPSLGDPSANPRRAVGDPSASLRTEGCRTFGDHLPRSRKDPR